MKAFIHKSVNKRINRVDARKVRVVPGVIAKKYSNRSDTSLRRVIPAFAGMTHIGG